MKRNRLLRAFLFMSFAATAAAYPPSNEQVIFNSLSAAVDSQIVMPSAESVRIITDGLGLNRLFSEAIAEGMKSKSSQISIGSAPDSTSDNLLFDLLGFDLAYKNGSSRGFLKSRRIKRELHCELRISIRGGSSGLLLQMRNISIEYGDEIEPSELRFINSRDIVELTAEPPGSAWSRYVEPSFVIASVGVLVYLFFANR